MNAVIAFARTLSLSVTAEGIETVEQPEQLQSLGCDRGQGADRKDSGGRVLPELLDTTTVITSYELRI